MKLLITLILTQFSLGALQAQENVGSYIFPKGILAAHYIYVGTKGNDIDEMRSRIMYIQNGNRIKFQKTELYEGTASSYIKRTFSISDSIIYLESQTGGSQDYDFGTDNIYVKLPPVSKTIKWETNEGGTLYKCEARREKRQYNGELVNAIIIERTPVENNKILINFKSKMIFIYGVGLYQEGLFDRNHPIYRLETLEKL
jgi:hypothetical protein